jgi:hypothetical protein
MRRPTITAALIATLALLLFGVWVGAFETFGGYVWRQNAFAATSLIVGIGVSALLRFRAEVRWLVVLACFGLSQGAYVFGTALGQVAYVGPASAADFLHLLVLALKRQL